ncbi:hypothetical protein FRB95_004960 [Tulasnella sp. JGI-2019a]|nr:hypothetical protein FRB95_004960 [Tulasnella sp. JGI-2019a]
MMVMAEMRLVRVTDGEVWKDKMGSTMRVLFIVAELEAVTAIAAMTASTLSNIPSLSSNLVWVQRRTSK